MKQMTIEEAIQFAIDQEVKAKNTYIELMKKAKDPSVKEVLEEMRDIESEHQQRLENLDIETVKRKQKKALTKFVHLKLAEYMVDISIDEASTCQDVLVAATKMELKAVKMYEDMAEQHKDIPELYDFFNMMVTEETIHMDKMEELYDTHILKED